MWSCLLCYQLVILVNVSLCLTSPRSTCCYFHILVYSFIVISVFQNLYYQWSRIVLVETFRVIPRPIPSAPEWSRDIFLVLPSDPEICVLTSAMLTPRPVCWLLLIPKTMSQSLPSHTFAFFPNRFIWKIFKIITLKEPTNVWWYTYLSWRYFRLQISLIWDTYNTQLHVSSVWYFALKLSV